MRCGIVSMRLVRQAPWLNLSAEHYLPNSQVDQQTIERLERGIRRAKARLVQEKRRQQVAEQQLRERVARGDIVLL